MQELDFATRKVDRPGAIDPPGPGNDAERAQGDIEAHRAWVVGLRRQGPVLLVADGRRVCAPLRESFPGRFLAHGIAPRRAGQHFHQRGGGLVRPGQDVRAGVEAQEDL